jgi:hypothetical protein
MAFNVNDFRSRGLAFNGARPTLFEVELTFPSIVPRRAGEKVSFTAKAAQLPASIIDPIEVGYFGRKIKYAGDRQFQDWVLTIINDEDFLVRSAFEAWHNGINTLISNRLSPELAGREGVVPGYKTVATVKQYGKEGPGDDSGVIRAYTMDGCFPTTVDAIPLDFDSQNQIEQFEVTFAFDFWVPGIDSQGSSSGSVGNGNGSGAVSYDAVDDA